MPTCPRFVRTALRLILAPLLVAAAFAPAAFAAESQPVKTPHLQAQLVSQTSAATPGSTVYVALRQKILPEWHTYWRNPGDAGEPTSLKWTLPAGWKAGEIVWPAPEVAFTGPLASYVYSNTVYLPIPIEVPADAKPGPAILNAKVEMLVCKDICVPESADVSLTLPVAPGSSAMDPAFGAAITKTLALAPKPSGLQATFQAAPGKLTLSVAGAALKGAKAAHAWFFPFDGTVMEPAGPQLVQTGPDGLTFTLKPGFGLAKNTPEMIAGVVSLDAEHAYEISARQGAVLPQTAGSAAPKVSAPPDGHGAGATIAGGATGGTAGLGQLLLAAGGAFLGGLILNLMPCVFPVLAIKAAALARHSEHPGKARAEGLAYAGGVIATFLILAGLLLIAKAAGQGLGWGFQLQSPVVVAVLTLLMLAVALNLSGLFEIGGSLQSVGAGGVADRGGIMGAAFTGVLAVVVAAPCTAPFMAGAIGLALAQPPAAALLVFLFLGLGLALPFTLVAFVPALFKILPKPGAWMEGFRKVLAFPMYGTAAWLAWVFVLQAGDAALPFLFAAALAVAFGAWMWGVAQRSEAETGKTPWTPRIIAAVAILLAIPAVVQGASLSPAAPTAGTSGATSVAAGALPSEAWSPARVAELTGQGRPVFVDFTAAWCVTCQVNERTALATKGVLDAFSRTKAVYLKADWTKRDPEIAAALTAQGRSGVPLYLVYAPSGAAPVVMPQLLTEGMVVQALDTAARDAGAPKTPA